MTAVEGFGRDPAPPERLAEPVADLRRDPLHVLLQNVADAPDGFAADRDREERFRVHLARGADEMAAVAVPVGMRKAIAQVEPDLAIVGVAHERIEIRGAPRTHLAALEGQGHTRRPNQGRSLVPTMLPANAAANHTHPCTLDEAMPLKYAPMLQP